MVAATAARSAIGNASRSSSARRVSRSSAKVEVALDALPRPQPAGLDVFLAPTQRVHELAIAEDLERLDDRLVFLDREQNSDGTSVARDLDVFVPPLDVVEQVTELGTRLTECNSFRHVQTVHDFVHLSYTVRWPLRLALRHLD